MCRARCSADCRCEGRPGLRSAVRGWLRIPGSGVAAGSSTGEPWAGTATMPPPKAYSWSLRHTPSAPCSYSAKEAQVQDASYSDSASYARSIASSAMPCATVTCGWYENCSSRTSGPDASRTRFCSQVQAAAPSTTWTNTTGERGRNVPVPLSRIGNGRPVAATLARCASIAGRASASTSVGGRSVTWVGMPCAAGSPKPARRSWSRLP